MFLKSKHWMMLSAVGHGVLFSLALTAAVRSICWLCGAEISERAAGNLFLVSSMLTGALAAALYSRFLRQAEIRRRSTPQGMIEFANRHMNDMYDATWPMYRK